MVRKAQHVSTNPLPGNSDQAGTAEKHPSEPSGLRDQIEKLLQAGRPKKALDVLARTKVRSPWSTNAVAVCLLRLGQAEQAVELFRNLVLSGSLFLRPDVRTVWKVNFAIALLMTDNLPGCIQVLRDIHEEDHPSVQRLRNAIRQWKQELSLWEKLQWHLGGQPARRVRLGCPPGEL
jgi:predicted Zn-dependent protease